MTCRGTGSAYNCVVTKLFLISILLVSACSKESAPPPTASEPAAAAVTLPAGMSRVTDASQVCMVNDQFMGRPQIPVAVEGRTYFGCCPMCKDKLEKQPEMRTAQDPVTGEPVDKAKAVIVQDSAGKVLYFASESTLARYRG
jgi:YHS domain-containing protein